jgi:hypothetical protein
MKHPNQSFIDNFNRPNQGPEGVPTYRYTQKFIEKKRKQKFEYFVESLNNPKPKTNTLAQEINRIFSYNTLAKNTNKTLLETKQSVGSLPKQFSYNGLVYAFNQELNMYVNQHGHAISIPQATAFMQMLDFEEIGAISSEADTDGGAIAVPSVTPNPPETPTGLTAFNTMNTETTLSWQDNSTTETEFKIYYRIQEPNAPTNLIASNINTSGVTLNWQDNSTNESGFKIYYRTQ